MNTLRIKTLSILTLVVTATGLVLYLSIVLGSSEARDNAKHSMVTVIDIDKLKVDIPSVFNYRERPIFAYISSQTGKPVLLEGSISYDGNMYWGVKYSPGKYPDGEEYAFVERARGAWFRLDGTRLKDRGFPLIHAMDNIPFEIQHSNIVLRW